METDAFWALIERSAMAAPDLDHRTEWLTAELSRLPVDEIVGFGVRLSEVRKAVDTVDVYGAACRIRRGVLARAARSAVSGGYVGSDGLWHFHGW